MSDNKACLHLLFSTEQNVLDSCKCACGAKDSIVLMDTAVTWLIQSEQVNFTAKEITFFCLKADVQAHGLSDLPDTTVVRPIDESELVELVCLHRHCLSWK